MAFDKNCDYCTQSTFYKTIRLLFSCGVVLSGQVSVSSALFLKRPRPSIFGHGAVFLWNLHECRLCIADFLEWGRYVLKSLFNVTKDSFFGFYEQNQFFIEAQAPFLYYSLSNTVLYVSLLILISQCCNLPHIFLKICFFCSVQFYYIANPHTKDFHCIIKLFL